MRRISLLLPIVLLAACTRTSGDLTLNDRLRNPLFAEYYHEDVTEQMVQLQLNEDPSLENADHKAAADAARQASLAAALEARRLQRTGKSGSFVPASGFAQGEALLTDGALYFHPQFITDTGADVHVVLSSAVDPREGTFPGDNTIDLGKLKTPYGDQWYAMEDSDIPGVQSIVLWDAGLERLIGFAQLHVNE